MLERLNQRKKGSYLTLNAADRTADDNNDDDDQNQSLIQPNIMIPLLAKKKKKKLRVRRIENEEL